LVKIRELHDKVELLAQRSGNLQVPAMDLKFA
jgi:hypothetical protein